MVEQAERVIILVRPVRHSLTCDLVHPDYPRGGSEAEAYRCELNPSVRRPYIVRMATSATRTFIPPVCFVMMTSECGHVSPATV